MAYKFYYQDQRSNFTLEHAWRMLTNDQKWCSLTRDKGKIHSKRTQPEASGAGSPMEEQAEERPIGVKAAKAAKLKGNKSCPRTNEDREASLNRLQNVWAMKEKDFAEKQVLADKKLLANLIGKTEPLTEMETELKNKLISKMLE
uniref:Glutathione S-transferase T3 n=1 Tax=Noccaea caerulescens TaxID=107243 RepID=A0A1J3IXQ9_NOCCA